MRQETSYKQKFEEAARWVPHMISSVKKELKNDHLKKDFQFFKNFFPGKNINKLSDQELIEGYQRAIKEAENGEAIAEFIANRWLLNHSEIYNFFEERLVAHNPNFTEIEELPLEFATQLSHASTQAFGPSKTYLFALLNEVVFPQQLYSTLKGHAESHHHKEEQEEQLNTNHNTLEALKTAYEQQIARLTDRYEKKVSGLQKKYNQDTDALKKQLAQLQRKLQTK